MFAGYFNNCRSPACRCCSEFGKLATLETDCRCSLFRYHTNQVFWGDYKGSWRHQFCSYQCQIEGAANLGIPPSDAGSPTCSLLWFELCQYFPIVFLNCISQVYFWDMKRVPPHIPSFDLSYASMPLLCLESPTGQTLSVKVTKWPSCSAMHVNTLQSLWQAAGWGWALLEGARTWGIRSLWFLPEGTLPLDPSTLGGVSALEKLMLTGWHITIIVAYFKKTYPELLTKHRQNIADM